MDELDDEEVVVEEAVDDEEDDSSSLSSMLFRFTDAVDVLFRLAFRAALFLFSE